MTSDCLNQSQRSLILRIIPSVSWSTESRLRKEGTWTGWRDSCLELHAVQDADRLDSLGAIGIMRCAAFSAVKSRTLVQLDDDKDGKGSAEAHFEEKLFLVKDRMKVRV